jgi:rhodanese-related sulfurtransferase
MKNKDNDHFSIIDIRKPEKYYDDHIKGAVSIEFHPKTFRGEILKLDREKIYIIYCGQGIKSKKAANLFNELNFSKVYTLSGGIREWRKAGLPLFKQ